MTEEVDWRRERLRSWWDPGRRVLRCIRRYQAARERTGALNRLAARWWALQHHIWSAVAQCEIPLETAIGGGLALPHPNGIVIHHRAEIGSNCLIFHQVTIGIRRGSSTPPKIGNNVNIGSGAKVIGPVTVGDHAVIGANAVVLQDVPAGALAVGVPARVLRRGPRSLDLTCALDCDMDQPAMPLPALAGKERASVPS